MDFMNIANNSLLYVMASIIIGYIFIQTFMFIFKAWKEGEKIGISKKSMVRAIKTSVSITIIPSFAILISLIILIPLLGQPLPWLRLSVIGSAPFEMLAADMASKATGLSGLSSEGFTKEAFVSAMWCMTVGGSAPLVFCLLTNKKICTAYDKVKKKDAVWMAIIGLCALLGLIAAIISDAFSGGIIKILTVFSSFIIVYICNTITKKFELKWLADFSLSISIIFGMIAAVYFTNLL